MLVTKRCNACKKEKTFDLMLRRRKPDGTWRPEALCKRCHLVKKQIRYHRNKQNKKNCNKNPKKICEKCKKKDVGFLNANVTLCTFCHLGVITST